MFFQTLKDEGNNMDRPVVLWLGHSVIDVGFVKDGKLSHDSAGIAFAHLRIRFLPYTTWQPDLPAQQSALPCCAVKGGTKVVDGVSFVDIVM